VIVRIKYCGGCNASYDRTALVRRMQEAFPSIRFVHAGEPGEDQRDFALVVCGCPVKCADYEDFRGSSGRFVVASQNDFPGACREIEKGSSQDTVVQLKNRDAGQC
jgi:4-hydroxybutyrate CoA-transferase